MRCTTALCLALAVAGCASTNHAMGNALATIPPGASTIVMCDSGCVAPWQRAQLWLANHAAMKIQTATDVVVETFNPTGYSPVYGFSVTRSPGLRAGSYTIQMQPHCGNPLGCDPKPRDVELAFAYYIRTGTDVLAGIHPGSAIR